MTINLDTASASATGARLDRRAASARQDRFMLELERAAMAADALLDKPGELARAVPVAARTAAEPANATATAVCAQEASPATAGAQGQDAPVRRAALRHAGQAGHHAAHAGAPMAGLVGLDLALDLAATSAPGIAAMASSAAAAIAAAPTHLHVNHRKPEDAVQPWMLDAVTDSALGIAERGDEASMLRAAPVLPEPEHAGSFEKQMLHVYVAEDGVHAWLRDAQLQGAQSRAVAQAVAAQLAAGGKPLAALSINGRPVATGAGFATAANATMNEQAPAAPAPTPYPSIKKGNT